MFYREAGDFKTSYQDDNQTFPIKFDRKSLVVILIRGFEVSSLTVEHYLASQQRIE